MCHAIQPFVIARLDRSVVADQLVGCSVIHTALHQPTLPLYGGCKGRLVAQDCIVKVTNIGYMGNGDLYCAC